MKKLLMSHYKSNNIPIRNNSTAPNELLKRYKHVSAKMRRSNNPLQNLINYIKGNKQNAR